MRFRYIISPGGFKGSPLHGPRVRVFQGRSRQRIGSGAAPGIFAAESYDAAGICLHAIESALQAAGGEVPTRPAVTSAVRSLESYSGITGMIRFTDDGDPDPARYYVFRVISEDPDDWGLNELATIIEFAP